MSPDPAKGTHAMGVATPDYTVSRTTEQMQAYTGKMKVLFYCSYLGIFGGFAKPVQFESSSFLY